LAFSFQTLKEHCARNGYNEETTHDDYMNPEPGISTGQGDSVDAD